MSKPRRTYRYHVRGTYGRASVAMTDDLSEARRLAADLAKTTGRDYEVFDHTRHAGRQRLHRG